MNLNKYDQLRKKLDNRDFEGKNGDLDKYLYLFSFIGNVGSIFFAFFLIYPALFRTISIHIGIYSNTIPNIISIIITVIILGMFEMLKRYLIRNFSSDYLKNNKKINVSILGWLILTLSLIVLSFYFSISGSIALGSVSGLSNNLDSKFKIEKDSVVNNNISGINDINIKITQLLQYNDSLQKQISLSGKHYNRIKFFQEKISENNVNISKYESTVSDLKQNNINNIIKLEDKYILLKNGDIENDKNTMLLFIIIVIFIETLIVGGVYFREYFEYNLYLLNRDKYEKIYLKRDRYKQLIQYIYNNGDIGAGDKMIAVNDLKSLISEKTKIPNPNKFVDEFIIDLSRLGVFNVNGKKRYLAISYQEALIKIDSINDKSQIFENMI